MNPQEAQDPRSNHRSAEDAKRMTEAGWVMGKGYYDYDKSQQLPPLPEVEKTPSPCPPEGENFEGRKVG